MKKKPQSSIDGFVPRRAGSQLGELHAEKNPERGIKPIDRSLHTGSNTQQSVGTVRTQQMIGRTDIDDSLREIDTDEPGKKSRRRKVKEAPRAVPRRRKVLRIVKWVLIGLLILAALIGGYVFLKAALAGNSVFKGSLLEIVQNEPLKMDENGRSNFIIFGTAEDDEGGTHGGANLTDSILVMSIDQEKKDAYMVSLPRDLWVNYADTCWVGNQGKLNAAYSCASDNGEDEAAGAAALQAQAGEILGLDIQYYIHLNFTAVVEAVDAVGGVDVTIETPDSRGILDRNFDWKCNYKCYYVNYKQGEVAHLDGEHALALARSRNAQGGYGLPGGNFDREKNQQKIIKALREKAVSAGTLTNLGSVTGLIDTLGKNLRTNIETKEIRTLMSLGTDISSDSIIQLSLVEEDNVLVTTGNVNGQSIVQPVAGLHEYSDIRAYIAKSLSSNPITREGANVTVLNGTETAGAAQSTADSLTEKGFTIDDIGNAPQGTYAAIEIYQISDDKKATAAKLKELYKVEIKTTAPPVSVTGETDFVIIVGKVSSSNTN